MGRIYTIKTNVRYAMKKTLKNTYECLMCKMFSISIPGVMQIPSDGKISISSCDDHGTGVALLPEREDDFVTE